MQRRQGQRRRSGASRLLATPPWAMAENKKAACKAAAEKALARTRRLRLPRGAEGPREVRPRPRPRLGPVPFLLPAVESSDA